jgi:integrase
MSEKQTNNVSADFKWDRGVDYEKAYKTFAQDLKKFREKRGVKNCKRFAFVAVLLTQLRNGLRIGEAINAINKFIDTKERELSVAVEKRKVPTERKVIIPHEITNEDIALLKAAQPIKLNSIKIFCARKYKFNTHSLRYSFITHLSKKGYPAQIIAKITKHSRTDFITHYTQQIEADDVLKKLDEL